MAVLRDYAQLLRLPNLFTAVADPLAGWFLVGGGQPAWHLLALTGASASLYSAGLVLNDCFDYRLDCRERPERPLPRGAITRRRAGTLGVLLLLAGLGGAALAGPVALGIAGFLALMILFYNGWAKQFVWLGPVVMGTCRFANFLLGMRCAPPRLWVAPLLLAGYVAVLTFIARREVVEPATRETVRVLLLGIIALDALLAWHPVGSPLILSLLIPAWAVSRLLPMT